MHISANVQSKIHIYSTDFQLNVCNLLWCDKGGGGSRPDMIKYDVGEGG